MADSENTAVLARALKADGVKHVFTDVTTLDFEYANAFLKEDVILIRCSNPLITASAAASYSRFLGLGLVILDVTNGGLDYLGEFASHQVCLTDNNDVNQGIRDSISAAMRKRLPVYVPVHTGALNGSSDTTSDVLTKSRIHASEEKEIAYGGAWEENEPEPYDVVDLDMKWLKDTLSSEQTLIISETPCLKIEFPPGLVCEFERRSGSTGWSVGATIGYALAAQGKKRLITFITDSSFQGMLGEMSTMLNLDLNNIIVVLNSSLHTNVVASDCCAPVHALHDCQLKLWMTKVNSEKQLAKAIHEAIYLNEHMLCFIEMLFDDSIFTEKILSESLPLLFRDDFQEMNENLRNDNEAVCVICLEEISSKEFVISYDMCKDKHLFHVKCVEYLPGEKLCPLHRAPLAGPHNTWMFRSINLPDDNLHDELRIPMFERGQASANIETQCSVCERPYQMQDEKTTLLICSHTFCNMCFEATTECPVCGAPSELYSCDTGEYEILNGLTTITMSNDLEDTNRESVIPFNVSQVYDGAGQEMLARRLDLGMIIALEDVLGTRQGDQIQEIEEPSRYHQNEVNNNEEAEEPAGNEEMENAEADSSLETLETFWDTCMFDQ